MYDQEWDEWVVVLSGRATLRVEGEPATSRSARRTACCSPAHVRHRVEWTDPRADTVWLAAALRTPP
jgi:cupin 2 domain-containing protein